MTSSADIVHWRFQLAPDHVPEPLCETDPFERDMERSIILRPILRQFVGTHLYECPACMRIGRKLGV